MTEIKQCWAFHRDGSRCEHPAGHSGSHMTEKSWSDEDCATPEIPFKERTVNVPTDPPVLKENPIKPETNCISCHHSHKGSVCKCGCYEHIG